MRHIEDWGQITGYLNKRAQILTFQQHIWKRFKQLEVRRLASWGPEHRVQERIKGPFFKASLRDRQGDRKSEQLSKYMAQHVLLVIGKWEICQRCHRRTRHPGKRVNRLQRWRQECVDKKLNPYQGTQGHRLLRIDGTLICKTCGRKGQNLKKVKCGQAHRGRLAEEQTGAQHFWGRAGFVCKVRCSTA